MEDSGFWGIAFILHLSITKHQFRFLVKRPTIAHQTRRNRGQYWTLYHILVANRLLVWYSRDFGFLRSQMPNITISEIFRDGGRYHERHRSRFGHRKTDVKPKEGLWALSPRRFLLEYFTVHLTTITNLQWRREQCDGSETIWGTDQKMMTNPTLL